MTDLDHFVQAQDAVWDAVVAELTEGHKRTHWMWFVFPQLRGLGHSDMAQRYALDGVEQAAAYLAHEVLGPRLRQCVTLLLATGSSDASAALGEIDSKKLRSCLTLFALAAEDDDLFRAALDRFFGGRLDPHTLRGLGLPPQ